LVLATGRYIGEGFDDARLDTLFLTLPMSWKGTLVQYAGRLHRLHPDKSEVRIYDYVDRNVPMLARMFERRLRGYRAIGYSTDKSAHYRQNFVSIDLNFPGRHLTHAPKRSIFSRPFFAPPSGNFSFE
jgi:superfamily II DNA or RNA helicase